MSERFYQEYHQTDYDEVVVYKRPDSPRYYARIKNPKPDGKRYITKSCKTTDLGTAKKIAIAMFLKYRKGHSAYGSRNHFQELFDEYVREEIRRDSAGQSHLARQKQVFKKWFLEFVEEEELRYIEDWELPVFRSFIRWRTNYFKNRSESFLKKHKYYAVEPRVSTIRGEMHIVATMLKAFYIIVGTSPPDFHAAIRRELPQESKAQNRQVKTRGFGITPDRVVKLLSLMDDWTEACWRQRLSHIYARKRLYWSIRFVLATRLRVGTELYNLKFSDLKRKDLDENGRYTYHGYTEGKRGKRYFVMDQDFVAEWEAGWMAMRHELFSEYGMNEEDAYVFAGCKPPHKTEAIEVEKDGIKTLKRVPTKGFTLSGKYQTTSAHQNNLFRKFLSNDYCRDIRHHIPEVCGGRVGKDAVRLTMYDWRQTAITKLLSRQTKISNGEMAMLCGCSITMIDRHYEALRTLQTTENIKRWSDVPELTSNAHRMRIETRKASLNRKRNELRENEMTDEGRMMSKAYHSIS